MNQRELKERIMSDPDLTVAEKNRMLRDIRAPYYQMSDEELLQLIRDFVAENGRVPERKDLIYDVVIKQRFGPWGRAMERAGVRPVAQKYLEKKRRRTERKQLAKERQLFGTSLKKKSFSACRYGRQLPVTFTKESGILT